MTNKIFDSSQAGGLEDSVDFITSVLESSTEYSIIGKGLDGTILLWNEGAHRLYGYEGEEVVGSANAEERALKAGAEAYFQKPVDNTQLLKAIQDALLK